MTVEFQGQERTPAQMAPFLEESDRTLRQDAWELVAERRLADQDALDDLFDRMIALRVAIANEAGFASFVDYAFRYRERFDYGVEETIRFHEAIERIVVPLCPSDPGRAAPDAGRRDAPALGPGRRPARPAPAPAVRGRRQAGRGDRGDLRRRRSRARAAVRLSPRRTACSTWPTARGRPRAAIRRRSRTTGCRSSS